MVMKKLIGIIGICSSLYAAHTPLEIVQKLSPKLDINTYIAQEIKPEVSDSTKYSLLADISKTLANGDSDQFGQLSLNLERGRTTEELFADADKGHIANILFSIAWINKYPENKSAIDALCYMTIGLTNIEETYALDFLGITNEQRDQIVKEGEDLSDSFSSDSE